MGVGLRIELEEIEHRVILRIDGRVDGSTAPILERRINHLLDEHRDQLILDFTRVDYLSSAGLRVLLSASKKAKEKKGSLILFSLQEEVLEIVKMTGFDRILHICLNEKEALQFRK